VAVVYTVAIIFTTAPQAGIHEIIFNRIENVTLLCNRVRVCKRTLSLQLHLVVKAYLPTKCSSSCQGVQELMLSRG
jgi:hypothetical protein